VQHIAATAGVQTDGMAMPPALAAAALAALRLARRDDWRREKVGERVQQFRAQARRLGLVLGASETPIQPVLCESDAQAHALATALAHAGWWVDAVPARAAAPAHLRVLLSALHSHGQVAHLLDALAFARDGVQDGSVSVTALRA
jgi:8-amino-7-oxononanoate synthase